MKNPFISLHNDLKQKTQSYSAKTSGCDTRHTIVCNIAICYTIKSARSTLHV